MRRPGAAAATFVGQWCAYWSEEVLYGRLELRELPTGAADLFWQGWASRQVEIDDLREQLARAERDADRLHELVTHGGQLAKLRRQREDEALRKAQDGRREPITLEETVRVVVDAHTPHRRPRVA